MRSVRNGDVERLAGSALAQSSPRVERVAKTLALRRLPTRLAVLAPLREPTMTAPLCDPARVANVGDGLSVGLRLSDGGVWSKVGVAMCEGADLVLTRALLSEPLLLLDRRAGREANTLPRDERDDEPTLVLAREADRLELLRDGGRLATLDREDEREENAERDDELVRLLDREADRLE